tara:strand:- start:6774 stop:7337 length:564 start_codon:yes stop_codon:yes gene_type:complete
MPCVLNSGRLLQCKDKIGGIKTIFIAEHSKFVTGIQINADTPSTEEITALPDLSPVIELFRYELSQAAGDFVETITSSVENGTVFWNQVVNISLMQLTAADRLALQNVAQTRLALFVLDNNDNIWMVGQYDSAELTAGTAATGTAKGDANGYTLTFTATEKLPARRLKSYTTTPFDNMGTSVVSPAY